MTDAITLPEIVAFSLHSNHLESKEHECAIDRIGALGKAGDLAARLWHAKHGGIEQAIGYAQRLLVDAATKKLRMPKNTPKYARLIIACEQALYEWLTPQCRACGGSGWLMVPRYITVEGADADIPCSICSGVGVHRYSDEDRARGLGLSLERYRDEKWGGKMNAISRIIRDRDSWAKRTVANNLEKGIAPPENDMVLSAYRLSESHVPQTVAEQAAAQC